MGGGVGNNTKKRTKWGGISKKRCKNEGCDHRIRSYPETKMCNKCVNDFNGGLKKRK